MNIVAPRLARLFKLLLLTWMALALTVNAQEPPRSGRPDQPGGPTGPRSGPPGRDGRPSFDSPPTVAVATVVTSDVPQYLTAVGTVTSRNTATVRARVSGQLAKVLFKEGQLVKAGDVLAVIDPRPYQVALDQQLAQLQRDQAQLDNAKHDLERYQGLVADKVISQQQVDTQAALVRQYQGVVAIDQAQVASAKLNLSYTNITAPVSGKLGLRQIDAGNLVSSNDAGGIVVITQLNPIDVIFAIPGDRIAPIVKQLNLGSRLPADALDRDGKTKIASGTLLTADNQIDATTGTVKLKAEFNNADAALFPNQFVNVRLQLSLNKGATVVPSAAIQTGGTGTYVYVVKSGNTVSMRPVVISATNTGNNTIVSKGLNAGEQVVIDGLDKLREGRSVRISSNAAAQAVAAGGTQSTDSHWMKRDGAQSQSGDQRDKKKDWQRKQPPTQ